MNKNIVTIIFAIIIKSMTRYTFPYIFSESLDLMESIAQLLVVLVLKHLQLFSLRISHKLVYPNY